jgi:post-segregation antitoxin (ccd killing protein)
MAKKTQSVEGNRLNVRLPPKLAERLNTYLLKVSNKEGKLSFGIKSAIAYKALEKWLDENEDDAEAWKKLVP